MLRLNPEMLQQVRQNSPELAEVIQRGDFSMRIFSKMIPLLPFLFYFRYIYGTFSSSITRNAASNGTRSSC